MGRIKYLSSIEWLKCWANAFLFYGVLHMVFTSDKLRLRFALALKLVFSVKIKIAGSSSAECLSINKA